MRTLHSATRVVVVAMAMMLGGLTAAEAGPPLICRAFETGDAVLLPWGHGDGWNTPARGYDARGLTADTQRLLTSEAPVLGRMENLRRATIYAARDQRVAAELLTAVVLRALTAARDGGDALAWFDAGYLIESYRQASDVYRWDMLSGIDRASWTMRTARPDVDGYTFVLEALRLPGSTPDMQFAASLMTQGAAAAEHRRRAEAGARPGTLLAKNLER